MEELRLNFGYWRRKGRSNVPSTIPQVLITMNAALQIPDTPDLSALSLSRFHIFHTGAADNNLAYRIFTRI